MEQGRIDVVVEDRVGIMTINNPPANSLTPELRSRFLEELEELKKRDDVWTLIITGAGEKFFVAGADISKLLDLDRESGYKRIVEGRKFYSGIADCEKPVIAAINGFCLGGGLELALACDIRIALESAKLGLPEVSLGIIPGAGGTQRLPRAIGPGWAHYLLFTGRPISAQKAFEIGLIQEVVPSGGVLDAALKIAGKINSNGPLAVRIAKKAAKMGLQETLEKGLDLENTLFGDVCATEDKNEGVSAFLEKRKPEFKCR